MKNILDLIRANLLLLACVLIALASIVALFLGNGRGAKLSKKLTARKSEFSKIDKVINAKMTMPPAELGGKAQEFTGPIKQADIEVAKQVYNAMSTQLEGLFQGALDHNRFAVTNAPRYANKQTGHFTLDALMKWQGDPLFPKGPDHIIYGVKPVYRLAFKQMLGPYRPESPLPTLDSGGPVDVHDLQEELRDLRETLIAQFGVEVKALLPQQTEMLDETLRNRAIEVIKGKAESIHIYAIQPRPSRSALVRFPGDFPFDVDDWSEPDESGGDNKVEIKDVWLGQVGFWMQQDIVEAIARVNRVDDPQANVLNNPIKRLKQLSVIDGYTGIDNNGALNDKQLGNRSMMAMGMGGMMGMRFPGMRGRGRGAAAATEKPKAPSAKMQEARKLKEDFEVSHTGRRCNDNYDVRQINVVIIVDSRRVSEFLDVLHEVNFMTVLSVKLKDVDEYEALAEGYFYGYEDVVEAEVLVETVWMRDWTEPLMPNSVKSEIGILKPGDPGYVSPWGEEVVTVDSEEEEEEEDDR